MENILSTIAVWAVVSSVVLCGFSYFFGHGAIKRNNRHQMRCWLINPTLTEDKKREWRAAVEGPQL